jgi:hypothetical protein
LTRLVAVLVAAGAVAAATLAGAPLAGALSERQATAPLSGSTWYSATAVSMATGTGGPPLALSDPTVPEGDLAVAGPQDAGEPAKETYLAFDLRAVPTGATITSFRVTLPVDPKGTTFVPTGVAPPIVACTPEGSWSPGPGDRPVSEKPPDACEPDAPRVVAVDHGTAYTVDLAPIAHAWTEVGGLDLGAAITNDPANTSTAYQVVFGPASALAKVRAVVTYLPPATASSRGSGSGVAGSTTGSAAGGTAASGTAASSTAGASGSPASGLGPPASPAFGAAPLPGSSEPSSSSGTPSPSPTTAGAPAPATGPTPSGHTRAAPARRRLVLAAAGSFPPLGFFLAGILLALVLLVSWAALESPVEASAASVRGVGRLLRRRQGLEFLSGGLAPPEGQRTVSAPHELARAGSPTRARGAPELAGGPGEGNAPAQRKQSSKEESKER